MKDPGHWIPSLEQSTRWIKHIEIFTLLNTRMKVLPLTSQPCLKVTLVKELWAFSAAMITDRVLSPIPNDVDKLATSGRAYLHHKRFDNLGMNTQ